MRPVPILALVTVGGAAALSWEILWQNQASLALGVSAFGTAVTLAAAMAGMSAGSLAMGRWLREREVRAPLPLYGGLELAIGACGLLMQPAFSLLERLDAWLYPISPQLAPILRVAGIAAVIGPPALAMGATIPVFAVVARTHRLSLAMLYGFNTAGAAAGVLLLSFLALPALGVSRSCLAIVLANAGVFLATRRAGAGAPAPGTAPRVAPTPSPAGDPGLGLAALLVFGTGFTTFGLEVAWFRSLRAAFQATTESFAIMLASVLVPLAIGAQLAPRLRHRGVGPGNALALAGVAILVATPLVERMDLIAQFPTAYVTRLFLWTGLCLAILGPGMLCLGIVLPWCLEAHARPAGAARLYASNTLGSVLGSLLAAWVMLPTLGFARAAWVLGGLVLGLAVVAGARAPRWVVAGAGAAALALAVTTTSSIGRTRVQFSGPKRIDRILAFDEGPDYTVSAVVDVGGDRKILIDGFGASGQRESSHYMEWMGRLPMLLHPDPQRALVICFGTGQTANGVRQEGAAHVDVVDVSRAVLSMAGYFHHNEGVLEDPRVHPIVMDGRAWIRRNDDRYDVVTLEPMAPYHAGTNALYSLEFYELVASKLAPEGVVAQWVPFHLLPPFYAASVVATFREVFPDSVLWIAGPPSWQGILLGRVAGSATPLAEEWPGLEREGRRPLGPAKIRSLVALDHVALAAFAEEGRVITDDNQLLAYSMLRGQPQLARANLRRIARLAEPGWIGRARR